MSTALNDVGGTAVVEASLFPAILTTTTNGATVDLLQSDGGGFAAVAIGNITEATTLTPSLEESDTGSSWSAVAGVSFAAMTEEFTSQVRSFRRTKRYVRLVATITGSSPEIEVAGLIGQQKKSA